MQSVHSTPIPVTEVVFSVLIAPTYAKKQIRVWLIRAWPGCRIKILAKKFINANWPTLNNVQRNQSDHVRTNRRNENKSQWNSVASSQHVKVSYYWCSNNNHRSIREWKIEFWYECKERLFFKLSAQLKAYIGTGIGLKNVRMQTDPINSNEPSLVTFIRMLKNFQSCG